MNPSTLNKLVQKSRVLFDLPQSEWKHFTYILDGKKIISMGWNFSNKTHPLALKFHYKYLNIHSELHAITNFPYPPNQLKRMTMVNVRIGIDGKSLRISRPCKNCLVLLAAFDVREVWYSTNKGFEEL